MTKLLYILILVGAVSLTAWISASGEFDRGFTFECVPITGTHDATPTNDVTPDASTSTPSEEATKAKCNRGIGNGPENCDPGKSSGQGKGKGRRAGEDRDEPKGNPGKRD